MKRKRTVITGRAAAARVPKRSLREAAARSRQARATPRPTLTPRRAAEATDPAPAVHGPIEVDLRTDLALSRPGALVLRSPILVASGVLGYGVEAADAVDLGAVGALVTRSTTRDPRSGNPPRRMVEVAGGGLVHAIGYQNPGIEALLDRFPGRWSSLAVPVIVSIAAGSAVGYGELAELLDGQPGVAAIELNLSCPELARGADFSLDEDAADRAVAAARERTDLPLLVKLSASAQDIRSIAVAVAEAGADAIVCTGGLPASALDLGQAPGVMRGGTAPRAMLSGPPIRPLALRAVSEIDAAVRLPIVGIGGISSLADVLAYVAAGATAVAIGSAVFVDPDLPSRLALELERYLLDRGISSVASLRGSASPRRRRSKP